VFDKADSDRIRQSLLDYERAAVTEWPVAASGHSFPEADNALQRLYTAYTQVQPRTDIQTKFLATSLVMEMKMLEWETPRLKSGYPHPGYRACSGDREYWLRSLNGADASPCRSPGLPGQQGLDLLLTQNWKSPALSARGAGQIDDDVDRHGQDHRPK
jgi:hypothetical protein